MKRFRYKKFTKAHWEDDQVVSIVVAPYVGYEAGTFNDEFHFNNSHAKSAYLRNKKTKEMLCKPVKTIKLKNTDYDYIKAVYVLMKDDDTSFSKINFSIEEKFPKILPIRCKKLPSCFSI
jgi:hypothetical protein